MSTRRSPRRSDDDFEREIRAHIEIETARLIEAGMTPDEARTAAHRRFGNVTTAKERFYEAGRMLWLDHLWQDARCAARSMRRYPVAAIVAVSSLAAGIGATTVTLTIRDVVFRKPPPTYQNPEQLSRIQLGRPDRPIMPLGGSVPAALYASWSETFGGAIAAALPQRGDRDVRADDRTETVPVRAVTPELFSVLGVRPLIGHTFSASTTAPSGQAQAVISYRAWQRLFDGRQDVVGRSFWIDHAPHVVIGVMPERFWFSDMSSPIWTAFDHRTVAPEEGLEVIVRRPSGVTPDMLEARLQGSLLDYAARLPPEQRRLRLRASGLGGTPMGHQVSFVLPYVLATCVLLTLLIACANVAILMIAQWSAREHEIAIRASIGASRGRIVRSLLTESVLVATLGGALGVCATFALRGWVSQGAGELTFFDLSIDQKILVQTAVITLITGIAAGIAPALYETRRLHTNPLRTIARSDRVRQRWRHALVVFEITITVALLVVTTSMIDGYQRARQAQMGYSTRPLMTARVENPGGVPTIRILDVLNGLPGVAEASASTIVPFAGYGRREKVSANATGADAVEAEQGAVSAGFFSTLGVPMRAGRAFSRQDSTLTRTAIINESLAGQLFPGGNAVGGHIWIARTSYDVVGIVADHSRHPLRRGGADPKVFLPLALDSKDVARLHFLVRATGDPADLVNTVRREARDAAPGSVVTGAFTIDQIIDVMGQEILVGTAPLFPLITIGMLLTMAGIYGVLAFAITRRSRELAVRIAVGASGWDLVRLVTAHTLRLVVTGCALGVVATFVLSRLVRAGGGAGSVFDPPAHAFVVPVLIVVVIAALATWIPSRRAATIDPLTLLRST